MDSVGYLYVVTTWLSSASFAGTSHSSTTIIITLYLDYYIPNAAHILGNVFNLSFVIGSDIDFARFIYLFILDLMLCIITSGNCSKSAFC